MPLRIILTTMFRNDPNFIQCHLIEAILDAAIHTALSNAFLKKNTPNFILQRQQQTITNLIHQITFIPPSEAILQDDEALPLKEDSLMAVNQLDTNPPVLTVTAKSVSKQSGKSSKGQLKPRMATEIPEAPPYKSLTRELLQQRGKDSQGNPADSDYILRLRTHKEVERERLEHPPADGQRQRPRPPKGQKLVFDYEGKFGKGKEPPSGQFQQRIMESSVEMGKQAKKGQKSDRQTQQTTILSKILDKSVRNRSEFRKEFEQTPQQKRQIMLNSLKLSNSRTKLVFDGHQVTSTESDRPEESAVVAGVIRKKSSAKAGLILANEQEITFQQAEKTEPSEKLKEKLLGSSQRSRIKTVASEGKKQRISIQNEALKQVLLTEIEDCHFQLPKHRIPRTNTLTTNSPAVTVVPEDADLARIRERLNFRANNDKLPRILSKYSHLEKDILNQMRKKSKLP